MNSFLKLTDCLPKGVEQAVTRMGLLPSKAGVATIADALLSHEGILDPDVFSYIRYLKIIDEISRAIAELYDLRSPPGSMGRKEHLRHTGPDDILQIANYLYVLNSHDVSGCLLECGVSHGYSTCCLSHACALLQRRLFSLDSFEGLPPTKPETTFFQEGDYASPIDKVQNNVRLMGRLDHVELVRGWFADSLRGWNNEVALLWLDVDLYESAKDVMENIFSLINCRGGMILHEFTDFHNRLPLRSESRPPNAVFDVLDSQGIPWISRPLHRYLGVVLFRESIAPRAFSLLPLLAERLREWDDRSRVYREFRDSRTVRWAFHLKRLLFRK